MFTRRFGRLATLLWLLGLCRLASAHPMGNFSVNHYSKIILQGDRIIVRYFIDLAEIPTFQELQQADIAATAMDPNSPAVIRYVASRGAQLGQGLALEIDRDRIPLSLVSSAVIFPPGAGGLPTMKMGFVYESAYPPTVDRMHINLHYADNNYPGHTGWKEIVAACATGSVLRSSVPANDRSSELSNYPTDLLTSPPQQLEASVSAALPPLPVSVVQSPVASPSPSRRVENSASLRLSRDAAAAEVGPSPKLTPTAGPPQSSQPAAAAPINVNLQANRQQTPRSGFTELIQAQHLGAWFLLTAAFIAIGLGGLHALEPGHGKTIVAAYLVGSRGTARHAILLGLIVTASHTAGVFALGAITLYASRYVVPEQLYPWLGALSGITIAGLGCYMFLRRLTGTAADHSHVLGGGHRHWTFWKRNTDEGAAENINQVQVEEAQVKSVSLTQLLALGITGGIIPCPAALVVLLSAFALHRIGLGFFLIVAFSVGLAAVLIGFGMLMVYARRFMTRLQIDGPLTRRWLPVASSAFITVLGMTLAIQALSTVHIDLPLFSFLFSKDRIGPVLFVTGLGLILGMRHSTDADHVVAISTIVSKQRSIRNAALIGSIWGIGHTITIFIVGSLIILFGVEIPPRIGLSMEFSVALMLMLLGVLNLTGVMQKVTAYFTPAKLVPPNPSENAATPGATIATGFYRNTVRRFGVYQCVRPLAIGLVHGLAGSAAVALLVLSTIHNPFWATIYLLIFGAGTMIGMMCMTAVIALPLAYGGARFSALSRYLGVVSGMVSFCFGSFLVYQLGFVGGLFTSHPQWTPQ